MKTVIQVVQHLSPGGIETMALDLQNFAEADEQVYIISLEGDKETALKRWPRLAPVADRLIFLDKPPGFSLSLIMQLARVFKRMNAGSIHTHHIGPLIYGGLAARLAGIKAVTHTEHDAWHLQNAKRRAVQQMILKLVRPTVVADAETVADGLKKFLDYKDLHVIHNGIDTQRFKPGDKQLAREQLGLPEDTKLIGCAGRLEQVKGQKVLLQAMSKLPETIHLALAGIGAMEVELKQLARDLGIAERTHFLGRIDDMPIFYHSLDLFCLPSFKEGMPLSPLEAQACGIPALLTDAGGSHETLCRDSGQLVQTGDPEAMAEAARKLLSEGSEKNPRQFVQRQGDVRQMAKSYAELRNAA